MMMDDSVLNIAAGDEIRPYRIHVSSKYLDLTKKKLELTRLPHELPLPQSREWEHGTPKSEIEPLIDFWLEQYSWRTQESHLNTTIPQFQTTISIPSSPSPYRVRFTYLKSPHAHAVPLLLLPAFPLTNLSLGKLLEPLANPQDPQQDHPFHVIAPSIPGLGFSDAFTATPGPAGSVLRDTAYLFNALMLRLGYEYYITSSAGSGAKSPAHVDYHLPRILGTTYSDHCLGIHIVDPPVQPPALSFSPLNWTKFAIAKFFHAPIFGYTAADWAALKEDHIRRLDTASRLRTAQGIEADSTTATRLFSRRTPKSPKLNAKSYGAVGLLGLREPNTLAYALCDSPVGLLSLVLNGLRQISPGHTLNHTEIINLTQLAWLPGPEAALRFWSAAQLETWKNITWSETPTAVTVFIGSSGNAGESSLTGVSYICPQWAATRHYVVWSKRQEGRGGLIALERPDAIIEGTRGLAKEVLAIDRRLAIESLEEVVTGEAGTAGDEGLPGEPGARAEMAGEGETSTESSPRSDEDDESLETVTPRRSREVA